MFYLGLHKNHSCYIINCLLAILKFRSAPFSDFHYVLTLDIIQYQHCARHLESTTCVEES